MTAYDHMVRVSLAAAAGGRGVLSTGEQLAAAVVLNRPDWLAELGFTIPEALARLGVEWVAHIPGVAQAVARDLADRDVAALAAMENTQVAMAFASGADDGGAHGVDFMATYATHSYAPGYRDVDLVFDLHRRDNPHRLRASIRVGVEDGESLVRDIQKVHAMAWANGTPLDLHDGDNPPTWAKVDMS